ncbi:MAG: abhydrolase domain-containing 18 [Acidobacteriota bacterium]
MTSLYARWMSDWENDLCSRATNRVVRPFDWGLEWTKQWPGATPYPADQDAHAYLKALNEAVIANSDQFFGYSTPTDFSLEEAPGTRPLLRFTSPVATPYPENNLVHAQWYPAEAKPGRRKVAAIVLPHWNASLGQHGALCAGIAKFGMSAMRLSLPYHDYRMPAELERADYAVSSNIARTIDATRQAVLDIRCATDWLEQQGYESIGIVGTSLGSCYAFLASTHDPRLKVNVFNHCSTYFADVVWEGLSTQHIRQSLEPAISLDQLRDAWKVISPPYFIDRYAKLGKKPLFMYARYDTTFPFRFSQQVVDKARELGFEHKAVVLPCGHYTLGETPFKFMAGYQIINHLKRNL